MRSHADIVEAFGGIKPLAEAIRIDWRRAVHWKTRGIPSKYWLCVEDAAIKRKIPVTARTLRDLVAPRRGRSASSSARRKVREPLPAEAA